MKFLHLTFLAILFLPFFSACNSDDEPTPDPTNNPPIENIPDDCRLTEVSVELDATTTLGLFDIAYDDDGVITSAGLQTYEFSYDTDGNLVEALLVETSFNPRVQFVFTYDNGMITKITENWGVAPNIEERHVFTPFYNSFGQVTTLFRDGLGGQVQLNYEFDANGNPLLWTNPTFGDTRTFTFGDDKGLFEDLDHNLAFAYGIAIAQPFFHVRNNILSEQQFDANGNLEESSTFSQLTYNVLDFQIRAGDPQATTYLFDYDCK
jgi:YD repeat-containing protein